MTTIRRTLHIVLLTVLTAAMPSMAQDLTPLPAEVRADFDARLEAIDMQVRDIRAIEARAEAEDAELLRAISAKRADDLLTDVFDMTLKLARDVARRRDAGYDVASFVASLAEDLEPFPAKAILALERMDNEVRFPTSDLEPAELVRLDQELLVAVRRSDAVMAALVLHTEIAQTVGLDISSEVEFLRNRLPDSAANRSAFLSLSLDRVGVTRAAAATLPDNMALGDRARAAEARVRVASQALQETVRLMNAMGLDTRVYRQQILTATGEVTTDVLDVGILRGLIVEWSARSLAFAREEGPRLLLRLFMFALIVYVAARLGRLAKRLAHKALDRGTARMSNLLQQMIVGTIGNIIFLVGLLIGLSQLGISLGPLLAGLGIIGFIVGFALQDTLSNFASGMMILMYRPFDVGDFVTAGGISGRVEKMSLVNSTFKTFDNQVLLVPNSEIWGSVIINYTDQEVRRVDLEFRIAYDEDFARVEAIIRDVLSDYDKVLDDPRPNIRINEIGEYFVNVIVRPWVQTEDYWDADWDLKRFIKERLDAEGITIPYPQRTVHMAPAGPATPQS